MFLSCSLLEIFQPASNAALATVTNNISRLMKTVNSAQTSYMAPHHAMNPLLLAQNTQKVRVRALNTVVAAQTEPVRVPSWPICFAMT